MRYRISKVLHNLLKVQILVFCRDESALKVVEEFLSDGNYTTLRAKFTESWSNEKNRRRIGIKANQYNYLQQVKMTCLLTNSSCSFFY